VAARFVRELFETARHPTAPDRQAVALAIAICCAVIGLGI
jgi:hypothetical protein